MAGDEVVEKNITVQNNGAVCPFSKGRWKKAGDALVLVMLVGMPILYLVVFLLTR
ncbi:MAG: hypothetical protein ACW98U_02280 [Candidatus Thorarchaeota archaeon]|jgi:hypothetical protein